MLYDSAWFVLITFIGILMAIVLCLFGGLQMLPIAGRRGTGKILALLRICFDLDICSGLPNRRAFNRRVVNSSAGALNKYLECAVLCIEVTGFRAVDSLLNPGFEERFMCEVAANLTAAVRANIVHRGYRGWQVARVAEHTFATFIVGHEDTLVLERLAVSLVECVGSIHTSSSERNPIVLSASVGIAQLCEQTLECPETLTTHALVAAQSACESGIGKWMHFSELAVEEGRARSALVNDLRKAIAGRQFSLEYQPQIDARSQRIVAVEALLRWNHPQRGVVYPDAFIHAAEAFGLIGVIGDWVIEEACRQSAEWRRQGLRLHLAINLSVIQLRRPDIVTSIFNTLKRYNIPPSRLTCEVTESVAMDQAVFERRTMTALAEAGVQIAIDDFGTGYSSLSYIHRLPIHEIKIDRSFVNRVAGNGSVRKVLEAICQMARALSVRVVAEGVETEAQRDVLLKLGVDQFQGFLYAKPMKPDALLAWAIQDHGVNEAFSGKVFLDTDFEVETMTI